MSFVRRSLSVCTLTGVLLSTLWGQTSQSSPSQATHHQQQSSQTNCTNNGTYVNGKGETVKRPETCSTTPEGATARCRDGSYSFSRSRRGTCSHHGGVGNWL